MDCYDGCTCQCDSALVCNSRPLWPELFWASQGDRCFPATECKDPCTEYIPYPTIDTLNATCQELLSTRTLVEVDVMFEFWGYSNACRDLKCCRKPSTCHP